MATTIIKMAKTKKKKTDAKSKTVKKTAPQKINEGMSEKAIKAADVNLPAEKADPKKTTTRNINIGMPVDENTLKDLKEKARKLDK